MYSLSKYDQYGKIVWITQQEEMILPMFVNKQLLQEKLPHILKGKVSKNIINVINKF